MIQLLTEILSNKLIQFPELKEYNDIVIAFISSYKESRPDMSIEGCKSLIEGLSKFIFINIDKNVQNLTKWKHLSFKEKFESCVLKLNLDGYENEFLQINGDLIFKLGQIRNERGDISHGQAYPKNSYSNTNFAEFIISWSDGLCSFMLSRYIDIKEKQKEEESESIYTNQQIEEFDDYLDEMHPDIDISYSKALKSQDQLKYEMLIDDYFSSQESI